MPVIGHAFVGIITAHEFEPGGLRHPQTLGDVLGRIRFRQDVFVVERHGEPVATLAPLPGSTHGGRLKGALRGLDRGAPTNPLA